MGRRPGRVGGARARTRWNRRLSHRPGQVGGARARTGRSRRLSRRSRIGRARARIRWNRGVSHYPGHVGGAGTRTGRNRQPGRRTRIGRAGARIGPSRRLSHRRSRIRRAGTGTGPRQTPGSRPGALVRRGGQRGSALTGRLRDICDLRPRRGRYGGCGGYGEHDRRHHDHRERDPTRGKSADPPSQNVMRPSTVKPHQNPLPTQFPGFDLFRGAQDQLTPVGYPDRRNLTGDLDKHLSCQSQRSSPIRHERTRRGNSGPSRHTMT
ncbi:hypothetical protein SAMN05216276_102048 [Streptosporangium subroseum]|uniref:Uncharacterized protein n=1 Tax=Streptosporangium subroseum TaxID=106412 RepID=A0A239IP28_9ACTN|nr:hypothetical protein SAMN05216276_102048 [Streptosporangium subroseum]